MKNNEKLKILLFFSQFQLLYLVHSILGFKHHHRIAHEMQPLQHSTAQHIREGKRNILERVRVTHTIF
jgi:hypothetical protein